MLTSEKLGIYISNRNILEEMRVYMLIKISCVMHTISIFGYWLIFIKLNWFILITFYLS